MPIHHGIEVPLWHFLLVIYVSVCKKQLLALVYQQQVIAKNREVEQHLVYLAVAVSANCHNVFGACIQQLYNTFGVEPFGNRVAWTVVQYIAQYAKHVTTLLVVEFQHLFQGRTAAVNI